MEPLKPVSQRLRLALGAAFFIVFFAAWGLSTFGGLIDSMFLKDPLYTLKSGIILFRDFGFVKDVGITVFRVVAGFALAALVAVPLGIAMGAFKPIEAFFEPFVSFARYLPASAFIPLLILWAGIGEAQKLAVIVGSTRRDLIEAAYTLGADSAGIVRRVMLPGAAPQIAECLRLVLGWAWTYVIVAELVGSSSGIGHMIMDSQRLLDTGQMIFGIVCIGVIGLISDFIFKWVNQRLYPWAF